MSKIKAVALPATPPEIIALLKSWLQITAWLDEAKKNEIEMRVKLASHFFPKPREGTQHGVTAERLQVSLDQKVNRTIDEAALDAIMQLFPQESPYRQVGILIRYKPDLILDTYRSMSEQDRLIFSQALTEKDGLPQLEVTDQVTAEIVAAEPQTGAIAITGQTGVTAEMKQLLAANAPKKRGRKTNAERQAAAAGRPA